MSLPIFRQTTIHPLAQEESKEPRGTEGTLPAGVKMDPLLDTKPGLLQYPEQFPFSVGVQVHFRDAAVIEELVAPFQVPVQSVVRKWLSR